jgi:CHAT domain-containing protein
MKNYSRVLSIAYILLSFNSFAQIDVKKFGGQIVTKENLSKVKGAIIKKLDEARQEYDSATFNYAVALSDNAGLFESEQRYQKNQKMLLEVLQTSEGQKNTPAEKAFNYNEVGEMMYAGNNFTAAENSFKKSVRLFEQEGETRHPVYALAVSNLGLLYHTTGRYELSEQYTVSALNLRKEIFGTVNASYAASVNNLSVLYKDMGKYNESEQLIQEAIAVNEKTVSKSSVPYALSLNNQAMLYQATGRYIMAEPILKQSIDIAGKTLKDKSTNYVRLMVNLALLYQEMKKYQEAEEIYNKAIKIKESQLGTSHPDYAHLLNNLAALYMQMKKYEKVEGLLKRSASIYKKQFGEEHPSYASTISNLGNFYRLMNRNSEAEPLLKQCLEIRRKTLGENHPDFVNAKESLALLYWQGGNISEAGSLFKQVLDKNIEHIHAYFAPMSEAEKAKFWEKMQSKFQKYNSFAAENYGSYPEIPGQVYNYHIATKALLLNSSNKVKQQILSSGDKELISEYLKWLDEKEYLGRLYSLSKAELTSQKINLDSIERSCNEREKRLSQKSGIFSQGYSINATTYKDIQKVLDPGDACIEIIQLQKFNRIITDSIYYIALILTKENSQPKMVVLNNGNQLEKKFFNIYRNSIKQKLKDNSSYDQYWSKIDKETGGKKIIYISLDGIYNQINLNTLSGPQGYLIDQKNFRIVTNTKEVIGIKTNKAKPTASNAILIGFPDYGTQGTVVKLPGTKVELEKIKSLLTTGKYNCRIYMQADASEKNLKEAKSPRVLHIATHGFFLPETENTEEKVFGIEAGKLKENPMLRSGLMLAGAEKVIEGSGEDGILTAYEAMNLSLENTEIVVMSACETGLGDVKNGEGVYGLQRAFKVAGANAIIMSLWKVNDDATQELMTLFYKYYAVSGNKQDAFKKAQLELKTKFKDPYYWGAFVLVE